MKPFEIALFKHFIDGKGMSSLWINMYRHNHTKTNPASIEEYLANADVENVVMKAFYFHPNSDYGYNYWFKMNEWWLEFYDANKNNYSNGDWYNFQGTNKILRCNWDAAHHWKQENRYVAAIRMGVDPKIIEGYKEEHLRNLPKTELAEELLLEQTKAMVRNEAPSSAAPKNDTETPSKPSADEFVDVDDENDDFVDVDVKQNKRGRRRLKDDDISINTRDGKGRLTINQKITAEIKARGGYEYVSLLWNKKGDVAIKFNDEKGVTFSDGFRNHDNANITNKDFVAKLIELLGIKDEIKLYDNYMIVKLEEISRGDDHVTYVVKKR